MPELEPGGTAVKLSITHSIEREPSKLIVAVSGGWPKVISNLKSLQRVLTNRKIRLARNHVRQR
jgi:hypothetical protein